MDIYINKLINNLPNKKFGDVDLVLDGGAFSGSYILGTLYYIKALEKQNKIKINKMSGCSIGSILCILYKLNELDYCCEVYTKIREYFKINGNLFIITEIMNELLEKMPKDFYKLCNNKIYLSYYNIENNSYVVKKKFKSNKDIAETILRSSYIPFICGTYVLHRNKYLDGLKPHVFKGNKTLFINLCMDYKCISGMMNIKNEVNNMERILSGVLDIHKLFITNIPTNMCYFIDNMRFSQKILHIFRLILIYVMTSLSYLIYHGCNVLKSYPNLTKYSYFLKIIKTYIKKLIYTYMRYFMV
jgi:hypothetical protein